VGFWSDRRRNAVFGLLFILGALYGAPAVRSRLGLSAFETDLIQMVLMGCAAVFFLRGVRATRVGQAQVPAGNRRLYVIAGAALAVVAFAVVLLVGKSN
jgi:hypothetical protein